MLYEVTAKWPTANYINFTAVSKRALTRQETNKPAELRLAITLSLNQYVSLFHHGKKKKPTERKSY